MAEYRYYRLDGAGKISSAEWIRAANDEDAVRKLRERKLPFATELWNGHRLIARIEATEPE